MGDAETNLKCNITESIPQQVVLDSAERMVNEAKLALALAHYRYTRTCIIGRFRMFFSVLPSLRHMLTEAKEILLCVKQPKVQKNP